MRGRIGTLATAATLMFATSSLGLVATAGTASAATPIVIGSCASTVQGEPGQPVSLSPGAVVEPVTNVLNAIPLLGPPLAQPFQKAFTALPPAKIGVAGLVTSHATVPPFAVPMRKPKLKATSLSFVMNSVLNNRGLDRSVGRPCRSPIRF